MSRFVTKLGFLYVIAYYAMIGQSVGLFMFAYYVMIGRSVGLFTNDCILRYDWSVCGIVYK